MSTNYIMSILPAKALVIGEYIMPVMRGRTIMQGVEKSVCFSEKLPEFKELSKAWKTEALHLNWE